jgi:hypothetical protein
MQMALDYEKEKLNNKSFGRHKEWNININGLLQIM